MFCEISQDLQIIPWPWLPSSLTSRSIGLLLTKWRAVWYCLLYLDAPHHAQCRNHGVLNLPYLWFNLANRFPAHFKSYCYAEEAHFIFIQREWSRTIVPIEGCWQQLNMLRPLCTSAGNAVLKLCLWLQSSHLPYLLARHTWSSVVHWRINTGWQQEHQDWWPACYWMLMTCCCVLSSPSCSEVWSCTTCIVTLNHLSLKLHVHYHAARSFVKDSDKPAVACVDEAAQ